MPPALIEMLIIATLWAFGCRVGQSLIADVGSRPKGRPTSLKGLSPPHFLDG